jgi:hypothetical protein
MGKWVLILSLVADHYYGGSTITAVPGFETREKCLEAADIWLKSVHKNVERRYQYPRAACVRQQ